MKHLIEVTTDTHSSEDQQAEFERLRELLMSANVVVELDFNITQVRQFEGWSEP